MTQFPSETWEKVPKIRNWIDRSSWRFITTLAIVWTIAFAFAYACFTMGNTGNGLKIDEYPEYRSVVKSVGVGKSKVELLNPEPNPIPWRSAAVNALYFSIATETTVGYGDLVPHGTSRILACLEALGGLMFAGVFVTKITTGPTGKTKYLIHRIEGQWIEFSLTDEKCTLRECVIISLITIRYVDGLLRYDGRNYDWDGTYRRGFQGTSQPLSTVDGPTIWFDYSNLKGDKRRFKEGRTKLRFRTLVENQYLEFEGKAEDSGRDKDIPMFGYRAAEADAETIRTWQDADPEHELMVAIAARAYLNHAGEIKAFAEAKELELKDEASRVESRADPA